MKNLNHLKIFEDIDWDDPFAESEEDRNYIVTIRRKSDLDVFVGRLMRDGFKIINRFPFGVLVVKNNGRLEELRNYSEVKDVEIDKIASIDNEDDMGNFLGSGSRRPVKYFGEPTYNEPEQWWTEPNPWHKGKFKPLKKK